MPVSTLEFTNLGPFDKAAFEFDPHVNVFVGPNNCGKTTALLALAQILVGHFSLPRKLLHGKSVFSATFEGVPDALRRLQGPYPIVIGRRKGLWPLNEYEVLLSIRDHLGHRGFVPALRVSTDFRSTGPKAGERDELSTDELSQDQLADLRHKVESMASSVRDEEIIQEMIELDYRAYREKNSAIRGIVPKAIELVSSITEGFAIEFAGIQEDKGGLYPAFKTPDGVVPLNVLSQGTQALIQWCTHLLIGYAGHYDFPKTLDDKAAILIVDEIDAHLHPSWQRRILPALTGAFPSLQVFCSTHSPLTLSGLKAGQIHLLRRDAKGKISVSRNETDILGWSADEIYTNFLDTEPTDLATTKKLERLDQLRGKKTKLTRAEQRELESLREEVHRGLIGRDLDQQVGELADRLRQAARDNSKSKRKPAADRKTGTSVKRAKRTSKKTASKKTTSGRRGRKA